MESIEVNGVTYVGVPDDTNGTCSKCAFNNNREACGKGIEAGCGPLDVYWVRKDQAGLNTFFGQKPLTYQILEHTDEEEEAWQEAQKKVATGVTDGPAERAMRGEQLPLFPEIETPTYHRQVGGDHYFNPIQPWDIIRAWELNYWEGNIVKYVLRHKGKNKVEDLEKARHYLDYLIENYDELYPVSN